jgi:hypothetical protein
MAARTSKSLQNMMLCRQGVLQAALMANLWKLECKQIDRHTVNTETQEEQVK